jgi:hypothetical protein
MNEPLIEDSFYFLLTSISVFRDSLVSFIQVILVAFGLLYSDAGHQNQGYLPTMGPSFDLHSLFTLCPDHA